MQPRSPRPVAPLLSRRATRFLAIEALLLCAALPVSRWLGASGTWLFWPWFVIVLAVFGAVTILPLLLAAHMRRAAAGMLLFCTGAAAVSAASLALAAVAYECHLQSTMSRVDRVVAAIESHRRTHGALPANLAELAKDPDLGFPPDELGQLGYDRLSEYQPAAFEVWVECSSTGIPFLSFGTALLYRSEWRGHGISHIRRDLGRGWRLVED